MRRPADIDAGIRQCTWWLVRGLGENWKADSCGLEVDHDGGHENWAGEAAGLWVPRLVAQDRQGAVTSSTDEQKPLAKGAT
jgi:hypothetical protein